MMHWFERNVVTNKDIIAGVGATALVVAAARAVETNHPKALINDPFAEQFVRAAALPQKLPTRIDEVPGGDGDLLWGRGGRYFAARTKAFDDVMLDAVHAGIRQVVILGAGLDTRSWRLELAADCTVYEIDQPGVQSFKQHVMGNLEAIPVVVHRYVAADLRCDWPQALTRSGLDVGRPVLWLAEGLLPYLSAETETRLLDSVNLMSVPGSRFGFESILDLHDPGVRADPILLSTREGFGIDMPELFSHDVKESAVDVVRRFGWHVDASSPLDHADRYGRGPESHVRDVFTRYRWATATK
jgi:methyltransferase (TIGR00027 family)